MIVNYKRPGVHNADGVILKPGPNQVDIKAWEKARKHPMVAQAMEDGEIVEESDFADSKKAGAGAQASINESILSPMTIPQAKGLVQETVDLDLLKKWKSVEKRNQVTGAINAQIEKLVAPTEGRDESRDIQQQKGLTVKETYVKNPGDKED